MCFLLSLVFPPLLGLLPQGSCLLVASFQFFFQCYSFFSESSKSCVVALVTVHDALKTQKVKSGSTPFRFPENRISLYK